MIARTKNPITEAAIAHAVGGLSIVPIGANKKPLRGFRWKHLQTKPMGRDEVRGAMARAGVTGFAAIAGAVSGGLEIIDFDEPGYYERWRELVDADTLQRLPIQRTGGGGWQVAYRRPTPGGNTGLAWEPDDDPANLEGRRIAIETRGEGGYAVLPPSAHPSGGTYRYATPETFGDAPMIEDAQADAMLDAARTLCRAPMTRKQAEAVVAAKTAKPKARKAATGNTDSGGASVINAWNEAVPIRAMLERAGYTADPGSKQYTRPGEGASPGGVVIFDDTGRSFHHSTNDPMRGDGKHTVDSFAVFCAFEHGDNIGEAVKAAARELGIAKPTEKEHARADADAAATIGAGLADAAPTTGTPPTTAAKRSAETLSNVKGRIEQDDDGKAKTILTSKTPAEIRADLDRIAGPVYTLGDGGPLFVPRDFKGASPIDILDNPAALFGWLKERAPVFWSPKAHENGQPLNREELHKRLTATPTAVYDAVATLPHYPRRRGVYYGCPDLPKPTGDALARLLDRMNPDTETDRALMLAALLTPGWGGPCGQRPAFVWSSDYGRGAGKTQSAVTVAMVWGGYLDVSTQTRDGIERLRQRLLSPSAAALRCVILDNVKSLGTSEELEGLITSPAINGHRLYHGDASRPNDLTYSITANGITLTRDMAERAVLIQLGKPDTTDFMTWRDDFLAEHRLAVVADLLAILQREHRGEINKPNRDRWGAWQDGVLRRIDAPDQLAREIKARRHGIDGDAEDWAEVEGVVIDLIHAVGADAAGAVFVPSAAIASRLGKVSGQHFTCKGVATHLAKFAGVGDAWRLVKNPSNKAGRGYVWRGTLEDGANVPPIHYPAWDGIDPATLRPVY